MTQHAHARSGYAIYHQKVLTQTKTNRLGRLYPPLPHGAFSILYADPPWHYNGKLQFDKSGMGAVNTGWQKDVFVSAAVFKYPTLAVEELKQLRVASLAEPDSLLFLWTTNPHLEQALALGAAWGFSYKTVAFVWNKMAHNPGQYTLSSCELCLLFKRGRIPQPRGARNMKQLINVPRGGHSMKPVEVAQSIERMFPTQKKVELFARTRRPGWMSWGLELGTTEAVASTEDVSTVYQNAQSLGLL